MKKYDPKKIELKWQKYWEKNKTFEVKEDKTKEKFYGLIEFPYPSGEGLHVGHPRPFTAMDVISRKKRMEGKNVLFPIGFDAFGLPTENFAIKTGKPPAEVTKKNIANFTRQLKMLGFSFDWSRQVDTTDPNYYRWTQWLFLQFFKHGLAYKKNQPINWCPKDKIGLANEEVVGGCCERCGTPVETKNKEQWMLAITKYAEKLLDGLKDVDYIERARVQQEHWIGKSEGALIRFPVILSKAKDPSNLDKRDSSAKPQNGSVEVFTTRPDTIFGVTFVAISAELAKSWLETGWNPSEEVKNYISEVLKNKTTINTREEQEKTGVNSGVIAINPVSKEEVPVWITNYVMGGVGTGAIMGVPAHDERDFDFAKKFGLPIKQVVAPYIVQTGEGTPRSDQNIVEFDAATIIIKHWEKDLFYVVNFSETLQGFVGGHIEPDEVAIDTARREITEESGYTDIKNIELIFEHAYGRGYKVRKSREEICHDSAFIAYLGSDARTEIVDKETKKGGWMSAEDILNLPTFATSHRIFFEHYIKNKPFTEPGKMVNSNNFNGLMSDETKEKVIEYLEQNKIGKKQTNYKLRDWVFSRQRYWGEPIPLVYCEKCAGWIPLPESELPLKLPKVEKYQPTDTGESPLAAMEKWVKTKCPHCGGPARRETDTMPNWAGSSWYFLAYALGGESRLKESGDKFWDKELLKEWMPVDWYNGGMEHTVLHLLYSRFWNIFLHDIGLVPTSEPYKKRTSHGMILAKGGEKMSKSKGNVVNPDEMVEKFGADALRTYIMFMGPFDQAVEWDTNGLVGVRRFLDKVWNLYGGVDSKAKLDTKLDILHHQTIKNVTDDIEQMKFNTAISKLMIYANEMSRQEKNIPNHFLSLIKLLSPFAPHLAEELYAMFRDDHGKSSVVSEEYISLSSWPEFDESLAKDEEITLAVQINGKLRDTITVSADISEEEAKKIVLASEKVQKWLEGKDPKKVIYVKGKLVSIVI